MITTPPTSTFFQKIPSLIAQFKVEAQLRNQREKLYALVVEDQLFSRKLLHQVLHQHCIIDTAETAKMGMSLFLRRAPDIIFLDIELPDDSGHILAESIKSIEPNAFIVMVTANHSAADVKQAKTNNVDGFIIKPYNLHKVNEFMDKYLDLYPERTPKSYIRK